MTLQNVLNLVASLVLLFGMGTILDLPIWEQPMGEWTNIDFEAVTLRTFSSVMFAVVFVYSLVPVCTGACGGLAKFVRKFANAARTVAGLYSNHGDKGMFPFALIMAKALVNWAQSYRFVCLLVHGDIVAIVAFVVVSTFCVLTTPSCFRGTEIVNALNHRFRPRSASHSSGTVSERSLMHAASLLASLNPLGRI